jgi:hypothetical protein
MKPGCKKKVLNKTLRLVASLLVDIPDWFIAYGTLLGITRSNSCIDKDDDVDILCNKTTMGRIKEIFMKNGFKVRVAFNSFLQFSRKDYCLIDFYCCKVKDGTYIDTHENVIWTNCYPLQEKKWEGVVLYLPNNKITKLSKRYSKTWRIPKKSKGTRKIHSILQIL